VDEKSDIKVLLADDEETLLEYMSKRLAREGFTVKSALWGEEGPEAVKSQQFDLAVVDMKMPGMDGVETQRALKKIQPFLQCIVLTGYGSVDMSLESGHGDAFRSLGTMVNVMISDNGPGIAQKDQQMIFDLFYATKPPGKGSGMGGSISHSSPK